MALYAKQYSKIDKQWEYFVESTDPWVWFGIGSVVNDRKVLLYPYIPKTFKGTVHYYISAEGVRTGQYIAKKFIKHHLKVTGK